ncbi:hypothetical protein [Krasilnikovia sp. MM14-A1259]|uniref:hypothetical protein n=1 Tax=Krasilnikovia sp. MM14-A1259 TaxID=3373539 RepID=UPI00381EADB0
MDQIPSIGRRQLSRLLREVMDDMPLDGVEMFGLTHPLGSAGPAVVVGPPSPLAAGPWRAPDPRRVPAIRGMISHWLKIEGRNFYRAMIESGSQSQGVDRSASLKDNVATLAHQEHARVADGSLYWVSPEMTQLAIHAGRQLPRHELHPYDPPSERGFMVFAEPLAAFPSQWGTSIEIAAVSWGPWDGPTPRPPAWHPGGVWFTFWAAQPHARYLRECRRTAVELGLATADPLLPDNEAGWPFGELPRIEFPPDSTAAWALTVRAAWLLMQQPFAQTTPAAAPPTLKPKLRRARVSTDGVQIIRMRPRQRTGTGPGRTSGYRWTHQTEVIGHWRRYHVGRGRTRVEHRWIDPYFAGPSDAPLRKIETVRVWNR